MRQGRREENERRNYFFWTYFRQSSITATRMMMPGEDELQVGINTEGGQGVRSAR